VPHVWCGNQYHNGIGRKGLLVAPVRYRADAVVSCDEEFSVYRPGVIDVAGGRIAWVGPAQDAPLGHGVEHRLSGLVMPGLVNTHCHSAMTLFRGAAEDMPLQRFLNDVLWPREAHLTEQDVYWGMSLACAELLRCGVTTSCEMYFFEAAQLRAVVDAGFRSVITSAIPAFPDLGSWERRLDETLAFHDRFAGSHDRVQIGFGPHSPYALSLDALDTVAAAARDRNALVQIHIAENEQECREFEDKHGRRIPTMLAERGFFEGRVLAAHSVWLTDDDLAIYRERDVAVAHCPTSNAKLASGAARLADMCRLGLRVGLGTDGPASNNDLDLWEDMRLASLVARLRTGDPSVISAPEALALATTGGAKALGWNDIGSLTSGRWADMVLVRSTDLSFIPQTTERDLLSHLVWSASSRLVSEVWVAGERVVKDGQCLTVDVERAQREVQQRANRLAAV